MSLDKARAQEIADQLDTPAPITVTRFFSGAGLTRNGIQFAFVIRGTLYFRTDADSRPAYEAMGAEPFSYAGRTKEVTIQAYYEAPVDVLDDPDELNRWAERAYQAAVAAHKPKPPRKKAAAKRKTTVRKK